MNVSGYNIIVISACIIFTIWHNNEWALCMYIYINNRIICFFQICKHLYICNVTKWEKSNLCIQILSSYYLFFFFFFFFLPVICWNDVLYNFHVGLNQFCLSDEIHTLHSNKIHTSKGAALILLTAFIYWTTAQSGRCPVPFRWKYFQDLTYTAAQSVINNWSTDRKKSFSLTFKIPAVAENYTTSTNYSWQYYKTIFLHFLLLIFLFLQKKIPNKVY
jgi:hypothetical protein